MAQARHSSSPKVNARAATICVILLDTICLSNDNRRTIHRIRHHKTNNKITMASKKVTISLPEDAYTLYEHQLKRSLLNPSSYFIKLIVDEKNRQDDEEYMKNNPIQ
jgi:hypothetical protein